MRRGDLVTISLPGDFGKPRPALVIQSDQFIETATVSVLLMTGTLVDAPLIRMDIVPDTDNGLRKTSQIMVDKVMTVRRDKVGEAFGRLDDKTMVSVNRALALFLGFG
ncbi:type II toxin-antitoxin system PemK/MazF family toxin [Haematospirillum jordaniae]|uniref:type II toxin-antitoxin system PemK/MazF family toxin n=1 Tax=Haematospirillum jordaniae TaxID=1549855 RepID=UPI00143285AD|nr:type II toxin-antitoxin system PemK/MazF family toxin [Haematospirillum jordaniae]NKD45999.1 type II toxin-antitoxin system PemK/MazF family toxin [Haematospirillum jordaniae]NKD60168.1 type II toxin-antitoxin system PemK/MazF family toxin [Haematospirillum jordaniae]NKD82217.1 type II toxin-antitoxin system PemK/MazF family toxin [Haematospirillum jordaniae]NKD90897.1 type II toxin-antitoxin system PemK/MazF family toxin [Haematospirillum jordaniae]